MNELFADVINFTIELSRSMPYSTLSSRGAEEHDQQVHRADNRRKLLRQGMHVYYLLPIGFHGSVWSMQSLRQCSVTDFKTLLIQSLWNCNHASKSTSDGDRQVGKAVLNVVIVIVNYLPENFVTDDSFATVKTNTRKHKQYNFSAAGIVQQLWTGTLRCSPVYNERTRAPLFMEALCHSICRILSQ